jgi:cytochrome b561
MRYVQGFGGRAGLRARMSHRRCNPRKPARIHDRCQSIELLTSMKDQAVHESLLVYRKFRYLKASLVLMALVVGFYVVHDPVGVPNGGTWLGYTLGVIGALLILWLMVYGVRKRRYDSTLGTAAGWLSAHVYLGLALILVATLHSGFQFGWNVHTLAYVLMLGVIASGVFGVYAYRRYPAMMTKSRRGKTLPAILVEISEIDRECREIGMSLGDEISRAIHHSGEHTRIGGSAWRQLMGYDPKCATLATYQLIERHAETLAPKEAQAVRRLLTLLGKKLDLVQRARRDVQFKAIMDIWLYFHVPLAFGLVAALLAHVVSVLFYW